ncbi:MAG: O-antigen ligase family protein [Butyrivibrio sp.]|nr:O-antigen ligase family protein [Butyrivibrio sp.]
MDKGINLKEKLLKQTRQAQDYMLEIYFFMLVVVYPFFMKDGYFEIGAAKYFFFRNVSLLIIAVMTPLAVVAFLCRRRRHENLVKSFSGYLKKLSVTDWFVYGYFFIVIVSYLLTPYRDKAFLGAQGWYMGLVSQFIFVLIYLMFSRCFKWENNLLYAVFISSGVVFLLGILNRYSIYPISFKVKSPEFISTLGNINWFSGYWTVFAAIGIMFYWNAGGRVLRAAAGIYVVICFISGMTQGSQSAYIAIVIILMLLFWLSFQANQKMYRFLEICGLFALSGQIARLLRYVPGAYMNYDDGLVKAFTNTGLTLYIGIGMIALYLLFYYLVEHKGMQISDYKVFRWVMVIVAAIILLTYIALIAANTHAGGGIAWLADKPNFVFNDKWGNARGVTWSAGLLAYKNMTLVQKLVGVGPDCFAEYVYTIPALADRINIRFGESRLTNAHNEWITTLVNYGALGFICYLGIFISAFSRFIKKAPVKTGLYLCAAGICTYAVHNIFSFQQVLNAPFVFLLMGIGEGLIREEKINNNFP